MVVRDEPEDQQQEGDIRHRASIDFRDFSACHGRLEPVLQDALAFHHQDGTKGKNPEDVNE